MNAKLAEDKALAFHDATGGAGPPSFDGKETAPTTARTEVGPFVLEGRVNNHSSRDLWVVETDSGPAIAHLLGPGRRSPESVGADGFRAADGTPVDGHTSWVKVWDGLTADVRDAGAELTRGCALCVDRKDGEFGPVRYDSTAGWGSPLP
jgi:hypothetical protein